jgi:hypothetical protein
MCATSRSSSLLASPSHHSNIWPVHVSAPSSSSFEPQQQQQQVEQRYRDSVASEQEKFEIPPLFATGANTSGASIFGRLSEYAIGSSTRRGSEFMTGES